MTQIALNNTANTSESTFLKANIHTRILIEATPTQVWEVFTKFEDYPSWNPFLSEVSGKVQVGQIIRINAGNMKFSPKVLAFEPNKKLEWLGRLFFKGIFDGQHYFQLHDNGDGTTTFEQGEHFSGILIPIFKGKMLAQTKANFEAMNQALKELVEQ